MFGTPWNGIITAAVIQTKVDICNATASVENNIFVNSWFNQATGVGETDEEQPHDIAIFYENPEAGGCDYSQMAQTVERLYPSAKYLLISRDSLIAMRKGADEPDTRLSLASVSLEDAEGEDNLGQFVHCTFHTSIEQNGSQTSSVHSEPYDSDCGYVSQ